MSPFVDSLALILAVAVVILLVAVLLVLIGISGRLTRIQIQLSQQQAASEPAPQPENSASRHAGGAFERFLDESPERRSLPKSEQFAAYRAWRKAQGMNWESR